ncbi:adenylate and guanylate cyclase catalytic domain containing protein [Nitzschia inconspicua]|uniref:Adenylate and guanylate cyclase catalytic domain containing protein n=1 Tax=Nitzschia inconspicua TaxID=303405 RepID=A0A9K3LTM9_9STRA|nr:adenylate and guanylate cyclase catalytic domain containing protein [Nitzschia inconspicua]
MKNRLTLASIFLIAAGRHNVVPASAQNVTMTEAPSDLSLSTEAYWNRATESCFQEEPIPFDKYIHKPVYKIGIHSTREINETQRQHEKFGEYLTETAGRRFDPPIKFEIVSFYFDALLDAINNKEVDFFYSNPGVYSCVGAETGASALVTSVKHIELRNQVFDLDVYAGVIATRADNEDIKTIADLKDKIIGAGAIVDLMGGQMQIYEMARNGLSYVNDPRQVIFMKDQAHVIDGILSGRIDAGFIRTNQIELTKDKDGEYLSIDLFKVIDPKVHVLYSEESGELFPFLHSTDVFPEWPVAALSIVPKDVAFEVQGALLEFNKHAHVGQLLEECGSGCSDSSQTLQDLFPDVALCHTTPALAQLAHQASLDSTINGFRTARSYHGLRTMLQDAGFMVQDDRGEWQCTRPSNLYEGITCPEGYFRRSEVEFLNGCAQEGLSCDEVDTYDCFCRPCVKAFDVDVYEMKEGEEDQHLVNNYGTDLPGCEKMEICGTVMQHQYITMRIYDNMLRKDADIEIIQHSAASRDVLDFKHIEGTYAYEFKVTSPSVQAQVIEILVNGKPIGQSPIRVMVLPNDCEVLYGGSSNRVPDSDGNCVCANNTYEMMGSCIESAYFFVIIFSSVFIFVGFSVFLYLAYKKKQNDQVWRINVEELHFNEPPEVIGQGGFGVVVLGEYRGTKVAVKRVLPPSKKSRGSSRLGSGASDGLQSGSFQTGSPEIGTSNNSSIKIAPSNTKKQQKNKDKKNTNDDGKKTEKEVKFGEDSGDIEEGTKKNRKESLVLSSSKTDWESLLHMHQSDNVLKLLESATASDHGSGTWGDGYGSHQSMASKVCPLWLQFDEHAKLKKDFIVEMRLLSRLRHPCITTVMGAVIAPTVDPMLVMEYMEYGSLYDLLHNETMSPGGDIILQIVRDITQGIQFLHASKPPILHGDLKAKNILVDSRFRAKVADFGFSHFKMSGLSKTAALLQGTPFFMAPEYLRRKSEYTAACDIYSMGMIFYEIYARQAPFEGEDPKKVLPKVCSPRINKRPTIPDACPPRMADIIKKCWSANPFFRPTAKDLDYALVEMSARDTEPLESFQNTFKEGWKRKTTSLYDVFPKHIADALNAGKKVEAETHDCVTVVFSDIVGFTTISETFSPLKVSNMLDRLYQAFDTLANKHGVFKVETIGDAYMGVTNLDGMQVDDHVKRIALWAQDAVFAASKIPIDDEDLSRGNVKIRVGFHSGPVVSNVIGSLNPRYGLFGDTVNTASRMESNSVEGRIHCTHASAELLVQQAPEIAVTVRGKIKVKGKGKMRTYWVGTCDPTQMGATLDPVTEVNDDTTNHDDTTHHEDDGNLPEQHDVVGESGDLQSHDGTHQTHSLSLSTDDDDAFFGSPPSPTPLEKHESDHIIKVHTLSAASDQHQASRIGMDGVIGNTVEVV